MECDCSLIKLLGNHFVLESKTEMLQMLLKDSEETVLIRECQMSVMSLPFNVDSERREYFKEYDEMLVVHLLHKMYGWKGGTSVLFEQKLLSESNVCS
jgi:hypothetical protein